MKALLVDPKTPHSFWTFDQSLELLGKKALIPTLGLITLAGLLPEDWELKLIDRRFQVITEDLWKWADVVLVSGMIAHKDDMMDVIQEAKRHNLHIAVGGPYVTSVPQDFVEAGANVIVRGEAETLVPQLVQALRRPGGITVLEESSKPDLSVSPVPRYDLLDLSAYMTMPIQTSRGCPFNCEFCDIINLYGRKPRYKTPDQVIAEAQLLYDLGWRSEALICDDNFIGSRKHARSILEKLTPWMESHGKPFSFWTQASVNLGQDKELIDEMTAANFGYVFLGIETPDEAVLEQTRKYQNVRSPLIESVRSINANGLSIVGSFIIGFDNEEKGADQRIISFVEEAGLPLVMLNTLRALPNTALWDRLETEGRLIEEEHDGVISGGRPNFIPSRPVEEVVEEIENATKQLYDPVAFLERAYRFYLTMRPTRSALALAEGRTPSSDCLPGPKPRIRDIVADAIRFLRLAWRQGVVSRSRFQFWRQLLGMYRQNPSRLFSYILCVGIGENLFSLARSTDKSRGLQ